MAFNRPLSGVIRVDGRNLEELRLTEYRRHLGVVLQDNFLFDGTVAENIRYGTPHATMDDVKRVAKVAHADEFIRDLPLGLETRVGEGGGRLSGGQRQRVAIARAMLRDAPILLLDEATSALDAASEAKVQDALARLMRGRTTIVIAHRLSTVRGADMIHVIAGGTVVQSGRHEALVTAGGLYAELCALQFQE